MLSTRRRTWSAFLCVVIFSITSLSAQAAGRPAIDSIKDVQRLTNQYFATLEGYQRGDIITQKHVRNLFKIFGRYGWKVPYQKEVLAKFLPEGHFLQQVFDSEQGRKFLNQIKKYPNGVDRVDRISRLPNGQQSIRDLIYKIPNGADWIKGMTTTKGGMALGRSMSKAPKGKDFNKPTGTIYFASDLPKILEALFRQTQTKTVKNPHLSR